MAGAMAEMAAGQGRWFGGAAGGAPDRLPRFADAMTEVARALTENLASLSASPGEVRFKGIGTGKVESLLDRKRLPFVLVNVFAEGWNTPLAFHFDQATVNLVVHALFGGSDEDFDPPERTSFSAIEQRIAMILAEQCADALARAFKDVLPSTFAVEPIKAKPDLSRLGRASAALTVATLQLSVVGAPVEIDIVIPQAALDGFRDELSAGETERQVKPDPEWSDRMEAEVARTRIRLQARLELPPMTLGGLAALEVGQTLAFEPDAGKAALLSSGGTDLFRCVLGQSEGRLSLRVEHELAGGGSSPHKPA